MSGPTVWEWMLYFAIPALLQAAIISMVLSFVIWFVLNRAFSKMDSTNDGSERAMKIVRGRYARGEISRRDYEQLRDDLETGDLQAQKERMR